MSRLAFLLAVFASAGSARADATVTIIGGADRTADNYSWIIKHTYSSPVVYVEFPHCRADGFEAPPGWAVKCTNLVGVKGSTQRGICTASADGASAGIRRGHEAQFRMRVAADGFARRGPGRVLVRFADRHEETVSNVELPLPETLAEQYVALIGLGVIFAAFLLVKALKGRKKPPAPTSNEPT